MSRLEPADQPAVTVVIATRDRPELLRRAVSAVLEQDYAGPVQCIVVFDRSEPHPVDVPVADNRKLELIRNSRTPGLAGGRNSGIRAASGELVAFCDDDDEWLVHKLRRQVQLWAEEPEASCVATGIVIANEDGEHERTAPERTTFRDLLRSRVTAIHPSSLLFRRTDLDGGRIGLVDEALPGSYGEDYELLLRASRLGDVVAVPEPLVKIDWARPSYFAGKWDVISEGLAYILDQVPEFAGERRGLARIEGQIAFAHAARARRRPALRWAGRALAHDPSQLRAYGAVAVAAGVIQAQWLLDKVQERGRGL
ncbi:glycosyltransferase family 2 protein [Phytoactinopolyspora mesophila]|uniref:Glycosyltransferase n=1 Tax=Phytoactinopolyspora mesophila TaxID=2650750 RepID=A0A7K3M5B7_9ACTN|nr:glycosyltransferase family A protein [Phytoactinopolyspora mesophila]NDL58511.1 glycosyltransferase [Phytoactinopolyspora mesophila]